MPLQRVVQSDPLADQTLAVINEQPQVQLGPVQPRGPAARPTLRATPLARPRSSRCCRTSRAPAHRDASRPSASSAPAEPARRARPRTARTTPTPGGSAQTRSLAQAVRPHHQRSEPAGADRDRLLTEHLARRRIDRGDRVRPLVSVRPEHDHDPCSPPPRMGGHPADTACYGRCHAPVKSRRTSPTGDERHNTRKSGPPGPTASKRVSSPPGRDHPHGVGHHRQPESKQQASKQRRSPGPSCRLRRCCFSSNASVPIRQHARSLTCASGRLC